MKRLANYFVNINKLRKKPFIFITSALNILSILFIIGNVAIF